MAPLVEALGGHGVDKAGEATAWPHEEVGNGGADGNDEELARVEGGRVVNGGTDLGVVLGGTWEDGMRGSRRCQEERRGARELEGSRCSGRRCTWTDGCNEGPVLATLNGA